MLSGDLYVGLSNVYPIIRGLIDNHMAVDADSDSAVVRNFKQTVAEDLSERFCNELYLTSTTMVACTLDPRFKNLDFLDDDHARNEVYGEVRRRLDVLVGPEPEQQPQEEAGNKSIVSFIKIIIAHELNHD